MSIKAHNCTRCGKLRHGEYLTAIRGSDGKRYLCQECVAFRYNEARELLVDAARLLGDSDPTMTSRINAFFAEVP